jgi:hypothetical protein
MRKLFVITAIILGVLLMFSTTQVFAQYSYFGLKGGVNISHFWGDDADPEAFWGTGSEQNPRVGFVGGVYITIVLTKIFAIQPEALISMMGTKYDWENAGEYDYLIMKLLYLQVPILLKAYIPIGETVKPNIFVGGYVALNSSAKYSREWYLPSFGFGQGSIEEDIDWNFPWDGTYIQYTSKPDYGVLFGIGSDFIIRGYQLTVDARYNLGLKELFELETDAVPDVKNGSFSLMVGIGF